jgi:uncharacterized repeat protein (TIGR01451 family)
MPALSLSVNGLRNFSLFLRLLLVLCFLDGICQTQMMNVAGGVGSAGKEGSSAKETGATATQANSSSLTITPGFFGMTVNNVPAAPWPTTQGFKFRGFRSLGVQIKWSDLETCDGGSDPTNSCYNWTDFDSWINLALDNGQDVLYVVYWTPSWASSHPDDTSCASGHLEFLTPGGCDPPNDLAADGTGTNQHFIDFLTAIVKHTGAGKIKFWNLWNEPNILAEWKGTTPQLLRLAKDLRNTVLALDPSARFVAPAYVGPNSTAALASYLAAGGGQFADVMAYHGYIYSGTCPTDCPIPENEGPLVDATRKVLTTYAQQNKPLFDVEGSWGAINGSSTMSDPDQEAAFTARFYLMHLSEAVNRLYWFSWNSSASAQFYDANTQQINLAGRAYKQLYVWTQGATLDVPCNNVGTAWTCTLTRPNSYAAEILWDTDNGLVCSNGVCPTRAVQVATNFTQYRDLKGNTFSIAKHTVPVGSKPILVQGSTAGISISKTASVNNAFANSNLTYTIALTNNTPNPISGAQVTDVLSSSLTLQSCSATGTGSCHVSGNSVTVPFTSIAGAATDTITLVVTVGSSVTSPLVNTATVNWTDTNDNAQSNWSTVQVPVGTPKATLSTTGLTFPNQTVGTTSAPLSVTVNSVGTGDLIIYNTGLSGLNAFEFAFSTAPFPIVVPPGQTATIQVTFTPAAAGKRSGSLLINDNTSSGTEVVALHGTGILSSKTTIASSANPSSLGQNVVFTATVTGSGTTPTGTVTFQDGSSSIGTATLDASGTAQFATSSLAVGQHSMRAQYGGDNNYAASTSGVLTQTVQ